VNKLHNQISRLLKNKYLQVLGLSGGVWILLLIILNFFFPLETSLSYSQIIKAQDGTVIYAFLSSDEKWRMKVENEDITTELQKAFLTKEDQYFDYHFGINPIAIFRALSNNLITGKRTSGASTITMQVARLLEPKPRTYANKIWEMFRAIQLEWYYSKNEIFRMYLNLVPYGGNIEGIKSASILFFGTTPNKLSIAQLTALAVIPNRPTSLALGKNNLKIEKARNKWLKIFQNKSLFPSDKIQDALDEPLNAYRRNAPNYAPHLAYYLHKNFPDKEIISTSIQLDIQTKAEQIARNYVARTRRIDVHNSAVLVVENATRKILAYVGSPDFSDFKNGGQVNGVEAYRSPGSTLKPIVYGLAFDMGLATPKKIIYDVPTDFQGYAPENYHRKFNGKITVENALAYSLNVPAVRTLQKIGIEEMLQILEQAQFESIQKNRKNLGLSLALGGCGVNLREIAGLYSSFANNGIYQPLQVLDLKTSETLQRTILSPEANYMLTDILTKVERPDLPSDYQHNPRIPKIAWKTGTSYGRRDGWSIGFNKKYTIAVWVGNFDGHGSPELTGATTATPLLFRLFNTIDYNASADWFSKPKKLQTRMVCSTSGQVPSSFCQNKVTDFFIAGVSPIKPCESQKYVFVNLEETISFGSDCLPKKLTYKKKLYPNPSPELVRFYEENQIVYQRIPPQDEGCTKIYQDHPPSIISPIADREYYRIGDDEIELLLSANVANDVQKVYWYIDNKLHQIADKNESVFFQPKRGKIKISCSDDKGRNTNIQIIIK